jgi:uncharacterized protein YbjT (DUF2867 family)
MKIVVIGGTGLIGSRLVKKLSESDNKVVAASPETGVNAITGEGVSDALKNADTVVDVSNSPSYEDNAVLQFFETSTSTLLKAEAVAGVRHHVVLSIVGTDRLPESGYYRAKLAQETLVKNSPIPYTIVRSTQFFEFVDGIAKASTDGDQVTLSPAYVQPIAADDLVNKLAEIVIRPALNGTQEIAGPDKVRLSEIVQDYLLAKADPRHVTADTNARYFGTRLDDNSLIPSEGASLGTRSFSNWLAAQSFVLRSSARSG